MRLLFLDFRADFFYLQVGEEDLEEFEVVEAIKMWENKEEVMKTWAKKKDKDMVGTGDDEWGGAGARRPKSSKKKERGNGGGGGGQLYAVQAAQVCILDPRLFGPEPLYSVPPQAAHVCIHLWRLVCRFLMPVLTTLWLRSAFVIWRSDNMDEIRKKQPPEVHVSSLPDAHDPTPSIGSTLTVPCAWVAASLHDSLENEGS